MAIHIKNFTSTGNRGDGVRVEGNPDLKITGLTTTDNAGQGVNIISAPSIQTPYKEMILPVKKWYEKPFGIVLLLIFAGLIVAFLAYRFGWS